MNVNVPNFAPPTPPETGASAYTFFVSYANFAKSYVAYGDIVDESINVLFFYLNIS